MKEKTKQIVLNPFEYEVNIVITNSIEGSYIKREKIFGEKFESDGCIALHVWVRDEAISYIFLPYEADAGYIAHESFHCAWKIMEFIGARYENEIMAYTVGHITHQIDQFVKKLGPLPKQTIPADVAKQIIECPKPDGKIFGKKKKKG